MDTKRKTTAELADETIDALHRTVSALRRTLYSLQKRTGVHLQPSEHEDIGTAYTDSLTLGRLYQHRREEEMLGEVAPAPAPDRLWRIVAEKCRGRDMYLVRIQGSTECGRFISSYLTSDPREAVRMPIGLALEVMDQIETMYPGARLEPSDPS